MKRFLIVATLAAGSFAVPALATDVGVSITIGQPGFYGRLDINNYPQPMVIYPLPMAIQHVPRGRPPIYLRVPPGHAKHWSKHCHEYHACGENVFFVQDKWYEKEYVPRYQEQHRDRYDGRQDMRPDMRQDMHQDMHQDGHREQRMDDGRGNQKKGNKGDEHGQGRNH